MEKYTKEDFLNNKVNLHLHSTFSDGKGNVTEILQQAHKLGYKKISFCDHNTLEAYKQTEILKDDIILPGIEFDVWCGYVFMHLLAYGIDINNEELLSFCAKDKKETDK